MGVIIGFLFGVLGSGFVLGSGCRVWGTELGNIVTQDMAKNMEHEMVNGVYSSSDEATLAHQESYDRHYYAPCFGGGGYPTPLLIGGLGHSVPL